jgi:hypothetical protein
MLYNIDVPEKNWITWDEIGKIPEHKKKKPKTSLLSDYTSEERIALNVSVCQKQVKGEPLSVEEEEFVRLSKELDEPLTR